MSVLLGSFSHLRIVELILQGESLVMAIIRLTNEDHRPHRRLAPTTIYWRNIRKRWISELNHWFNRGNELITRLSESKALVASSECLKKLIDLPISFFLVTCWLTET